jgi:hypothetical protein
MSTADIARAGAFGWGIDIPLGSACCINSDFSLKDIADSAGPAAGGAGPSKGS